MRAGSQPVRRRQPLRAELQQLRDGPGRQHVSQLLLRAYDAAGRNPDWSRARLSVPCSIILRGSQHPFSLSGRCATCPTQRAAPGRRAAAAAAACAGRTRPTAARAKPVARWARARRTIGFAQTWCPLARCRTVRLVRASPVRPSQTVCFRRRRVLLSGPEVLPAGAECASLAAGCRSSLTPAQTAAARTRP